MVPTSFDAELDKLMASIAKQESGGEVAKGRDPYLAKNPSGAYGKYQIMPVNWPKWAKEAGLSADAKQTPENQEKVARYKLGIYLKKWGPAGAAQAWYGGPGSVGKNVSGGVHGGVLYQDSNTYAAQVTGRM